MQRDTPSIRAWLLVVSLLAAGSSCGSSSTPPPGTLGDAAHGGSDGRDAAHQPDASGGSGDGGVGPACNAHGGGNEGDLCTDTSHCRCPFECVDDPYASPLAGSKVCERPCATSADCTNLTTFCHAGACEYSPCGPAYHNADAACTTGDGQPGSCVTAANPGGGFLWIWGCSLAGTATTTCDPAGAAIRTQSSARCIAGELCDAVTGFDQCVALCRPNLDTCPGGVACTPHDLLGNLGVCGP